MAGNLYKRNFPETIRLVREILLWGGEKKINAKRGGRPFAINFCLFASCSKLVCCVCGCVAEMRRAVNVLSDVSYHEPGEVGDEINDYRNLADAEQ